MMWHLERDGAATAPATRAPDRLAVRRVVVAWIVGLALGPVAWRVASATSDAVLPPSALHAASPVFGVLDAEPRYRLSDRAAGLRLAVLSLCWKQWEPRRGVTDAAYAGRERRAAAEYREDGFEIAVDIGLQCPPRWVLALPDGEMVDQFGDTSGSADFEFSEPVRRAASFYIRQVVRTLGPVSYYRVGLSAYGEVLYPEAPRDNWWAFDADAQRAPSLQGSDGRRCPAGCRARPTTTASLSRPIRWAGGTTGTSRLRSTPTSGRSRATVRLGTRASLELVMPGYGAEPGLVRARLARDLADIPEDRYHTMNTAADWPAVLDQLARLPGLVVDISSVGDGTGLPANNGCEAADSSLAMTSAVIAKWSDTRWLTYLARLHKLAVMGENPGNDPASALPAIMALVRTCRLEALQWAWDYELHDGRFATLADYAASLRRG
jgi:hypothetical protein